MTGRFSRRIAGFLTIGLLLGGSTVYAVAASDDPPAIASPEQVAAREDAQVKAHHGSELGKARVFSSPERPASQVPSSEPIPLPGIVIPSSVDFGHAVDPTNPPLVAGAVIPYPDGNVRTIDARQVDGTPRTSDSGIGFATVFVGHYSFEGAELGISVVKPSEGARKHPIFLGAQSRKAEVNGAPSVVYDSGSPNGASSPGSPGASPKADKAQDATTGESTSFRQGASLISVVGATESTRQDFLRHVVFR